MSARLEKFRSYASHAWLHKSYSKLSAGEIQAAEDFISANDLLDAEQFYRAVNRMFLDKPGKPKHWTHILELLTCANRVQVVSNSDSA